MKFLNTLIAALLCAAPHAYAVQLTLSNAEKREVLDLTLAKISEVYVDADKRQPIVAAIQQKNEANPYELLDTDIFVKILTQDLRQVSGDDHLYLRTNEARTRRRTGMPGDGTGYVSAEVLEGNVGYLEVNVFGMQPVSLQELDDAMAVLRETEALIIDLRRCRGGAVAGVERLLNYFTSTSEHYLTSVNTFQDWERQRFTRPGTSAFQYKQPVYVLIGEQTFSAGEDFAYSVQLLGLGKLVGQSTRGGGYMNMMVPLHEHVTLSVSIGKTFDPKTGLGWQGTGIQADVSATAGEELDKALSIINS